MKTAELLEVSLRIAKRIDRLALWEGPHCSWDVQLPESPGGRQRSPDETRVGTLYQGSAGIVWFLAELYGVTGEPWLRRTAEGGLRHALSAGTKLSRSSFGFHTGRVGIAYVAARLAALLERPEWGEEAWRLLEPLAGNEERDGGLDVVDGAAGAIPALLILATALGRVELLATAERLGDHLIARAHREPLGWSWPTSPGAVRNLTGLAHGSAGIALALLELQRATGNGRYRFAAEMAFLYERQFFDEETANWPDFRHRMILDYLYSERLAELRKAAARGTVTNRIELVWAWCHGSPGIGLSRLRAFELTAQDQYRIEARAALSSTLPTVAEDRLAGRDFCLCHGIAGNCELPLYAASVLGDDTLREPCERAAAYGWDAYEKKERPWPCGTMSGDRDASLMRGESGIGLFYLRLAAADIPSALILRPLPPGGDEEGLDGFEELAESAVEEYFGATLRSFERLAAEFPRPPRAYHRSDGPLARSPVEATYEALHAFVKRQEEPLSPLLEDAFRVERERYEATLGLTDYCAELLDDLIRPAWEEIDWQMAKFRLGRQTRLVTARRSGRGGQQDSDGRSPAETTTYVLYRQDNRIQTLELQPLAALLLEALRQPSSVEELAEYVDMALAEANRCDRKELVRSAVLPQLAEFYRAGLIDRASP